MNGIYVPGIKPENRAAMLKLAGKLEIFEGNDTIVKYPKPEQFDFDEQAERLVKASRGLGRYFVVAESIGTLLSLRALSMSEVFDPEGIALIGTPLNEDAKKFGPVDKWLKNLRDRRKPTLWIQNIGDNEALPAPDLEVLLAEKGLNGQNSRLVTISEGKFANSHTYMPQDIATKISGINLNGAVNLG